MVRIKLCGLLFLEVNGAPDTIRTCDRWYRKPVVYLILFLLTFAQMQTHFAAMV